MSSSLMSSSSAHQTSSEPHGPCHHNEREVRSSIPPADWVNQTTFAPVEESSAQSHFEFFYHVIFRFVHFALTLLLAPVLKTRPRKSRRSHRSSSSSKSQQQRRERQSFREVDPELAMVPPENTTRVPVASSHSNNNSSSILKSHRRRPSGEQAAMTGATGSGKSVRFPEPKRSRPPLGRISSSIGSSSSSTSVGSSAASVSESSSSSSSTRSSSGRGRIAPRYNLGPSPRTHHTTYFLSD